MDKKSVSMILFILLVTTIILGGCGGKETRPNQNTGTQTGTGTQTDTGIQTGQVVELKFAHSYPENSKLQESFKWWAEEVAKRTNGSVKITLYPSESLAKNTEMFQGMMQGSIDMALLVTPFFSNQVKEIAVLEVPGAFDPMKRKELNEVMGPIVSKIMNQYGIHYLWPSEGGETAFFMKQGKTVQTLSDLNGLKIRTAGRWVGKAIEAWGGAPMTVPTADVSVALERGTVDGGFTAWVVANSFKWTELAPELTWVGFNNNWAFVAMSDKAWKKLSPEQQKILTESGLEAMEKDIAIYKETKDGFLKSAEDGKIGVHMPEPQTKEKFLELVKPVIDEAVKEGGSLSKELIEAIATVK